MKIAHDEAWLAVALVEQNDTPGEKNIVGCLLAYS